MDVVSTCALRVASMVWHPRPGAFAIVFACKATYLLAPGTSRLAEVEDDPHLRDDYWNDDERQSLARAGDLAPFKRSADVLVVGHAHAPGGRQVGSLLVRLVAGEIDKTLTVHGDRVLGPDDRISEPVPFVRGALRWERAAGGPGTWNPAGMRLDGPIDARGAVPIPNLLPPNARVTGRRDVLPPVGFMPVAPAWPGRLSRLRHRAAGWDHRRWSEQPLPDDIDAGYFNAAPPDQQVSEIRADERLVLENLHPDHARLVTNLQALAPRAFAEPNGELSHEVRLRCDTLVIDTDQGTASLVWRGNLWVAHPSQPGRIVVTLDARGGPAVAAPPPALPAVNAAPDKLAATGNIDPAIVRRGDALPFGPAASAPSALAAPAAPEPGAPRGLAAAPADLGEITEILNPATVQPGNALPFESTASAPSAPAAPPARVEPSPPAPPAWVAPPEIPRAYEGEPPAAIPETPELPPSIVEVAPAPAEPPRPLADYPVERCAAIAASIARRKDERAAILDRHELTSEQWSALEGRWAEAIQKDLGRGKAGLLSAYDAAYVAQLEAERGAITVEEYARLVVSAERGVEAEKETLVELGLPRGALLRVQRLWLKKIAESPALGKRVREAVDEAGEG